jgi:hypothetical protein
MEKKPPSTYCLLVEEHRPIVLDGELGLENHIFFLAHLADDGTFLGLIIPNEQLSCLETDGDWKNLGVRIIHGPMQEMRTIDLYSGKKQGNNWQASNGHNINLCRTDNEYFCGKPLTEVIVPFPN